MTEQTQMMKRERLMKGLTTARVDKDTAKKVSSLFAVGERAAPRDCVGLITRTLVMAGYHPTDAADIAPPLMSFGLDGGDGLDLAAAIAGAKHKRIEKPRPPEVEKPHRKQTRLSGPMLSAYHAKRAESEETNQASDEGGDDDEKALRPPGHINLDPDDSPFSKRP